MGEQVEDECRFLALAGKLGKIAGDPVAEIELTAEKRAEIEKEVDRLDDELRHGLVELGAAARLLLAGDIHDVFPLDDKAALQRAKPVTPEGRIKEDAEKVRAREDAMVKLALDGRCSLLILGGAHNLSGS